MGVWLLRGRGKIVVWPVYLDSGYSRGEGRRVPRNLAVRGVRAEEVFQAAEDLGLNPVLKAAASYPKHPWQREGSVLVDDNAPKTEILRSLAEGVLERRGSR